MGVKVREKIAGSGNYYIYINHGGVRRAVIGGSKKAAEKAAKEIETSLALGKLHLVPDETSEPITLNVYSAEWLEEHIKGVLADSTHERYGQVLKRDILPKLGGKDITEIQPCQVRSLLNGLIKEGRTSKAISLARTVLSSCLSEAVVDGRITSNPVTICTTNRKRSKVTEKRMQKVHKVKYLDDQQVEKFLTVVMEASPDVYGPMFLFGFRTGVRLGELIALYWSDIDWKRGVVNIQRTFRKGDPESDFDEIKTGESRVVPMSAQLHSTLWDLYLRQQQAIAVNGLDQPVFGISGRCRAQNTVRKAFKAFLKIAGLSPIRVHDMRHTFATLLINRGANLAQIKDLLGHTSIKTTVDIYGHIVVKSQSEMVSLLDASTVAQGDSDGNQ